MNFTNALMIVKDAPRKDQLAAFRKLGVDNFVSVITNARPYPGHIHEDKVYWSSDYQNYTDPKKYSPQAVVNFKECFNQDLFFVSTGDSNLDSQFIAAARNNNAVIVVLTKNGKYRFLLRSIKDYRNLAIHLKKCFTRRLNSHPQQPYLQSGL